ncbi:MAG: phospholipase D family protein, partial [Bdellovibrionia bacterium]
MALTREVRKSLLEEIEPGEGRLSAGLIFTYSVEAVPLFALLSTLAGYSTSAEEIDQTLKDDKFKILRDLEVLAERVMILTHVGGFHPPGDATARMASLLDRYLSEVAPEKEGGPDRRCSFHPKLMMLEYESANGQSEIRFIVSSRNLTMSNCLDGVVIMRLVPTKKDTENGKRLHAFVKAAIAASGVKPLDPVLSILNKLSKCKIVQTDGAADDIEFFGQIPGEKSLWDYLGQSIMSPANRRRIVISPFIDQKMLKKFEGQSGGSVEIVSEEMDFKKICSSKGGVDLLKKYRCYELEPGAGFQGLHSKMILSESTDGTEIIAGSANWTNRGWNGANWEVMIRLKYKAPAFGSTRKDLFEEDKKLKIAPLCIPFCPVEGKAKEQTFAEIWRDRLARGVPTFRIEQSGEACAIYVKFVPDAEGFESECKYSVRFVTELTYRPLNAAYEAEWKIRNVQVTGFLLIQAVSISNPSDSVEVVRKVAIPDEILKTRNELRMGELVQEQGLRKFLSALLEGASLGGSTGNLGNGGSWTDVGVAGTSVASLEALYFVLLRDENRRRIMDDIMRLKPEQLTDPPGIEPAEAERNRDLFRQVQKIWKMLSSVGSRRG